MNGITAALTGRLGGDAELKYLPHGTALATFSVAVDDAHRPEGEAPEWVRVTLWDHATEDLAPRLVKGTPVYCEGRLRLDLWATSGGEQRATLKMTARECVPMGQIGRRRSGRRGRRQPVPAAAGGADGE